MVGSSAAGRKTLYDLFMIKVMFFFECTESGCTCFRVNTCRKVALKGCEVKRLVDYYIWS